MLPLPAGFPGFRLWGRAKAEPPAPVSDSDWIPDLMRTLVPEDAACVRRRTENPNTPDAHQTIFGYRFFSPAAVARLLDLKRAFVVTPREREDGWTLQLTFVDAEVDDDEQELLSQVQDVVKELKVGAHVNDGGHVGAVHLDGSSGRATLELSSVYDGEPRRSFVTSACLRQLADLDASARVSVGLQDGRDRLCVVLSTPLNIEKPPKPPPARPQRVVPKQARMRTKHRATFSADDLRRRQMLREALASK